jgi:gag-polypeptide of LTR copia-type
MEKYQSLAPNLSHSPSETPTIPAISTSIYLSTPTLNEWSFQDQLARGHITLNCTDVASLGVIMTGTAKKAWDSIQTEWGRSMDMRCSHAQEALNRIEYVEGTEIQDHIKLLQRRRAAVDNLSTSAMSDETWQGIIICSIPPTQK